MNLNYLITKVLKELLFNLKDQDGQYPKMLAVSPPNKGNYNYGDLVPLSFVLRSLNTLPEEYKSTEITSHLERFKEVFSNTQQDGLWAFNAGDLITCIDSGFIIGATEEFQKVSLLDIFKTEDGWFLPQLCSLTPQKNKMTIDERIFHWCQKDYGTLCLVTSLRKKANLPTEKEEELIRSHFKSRSGLFLANPYLVDWLLAEAIGDDTECPMISLELATQLVSALYNRSKSMRFDSFFSLSLCLLSLHRLGYWHKKADEAMNFFLNLIEQSQYGIFSTPFYSSMKIQWNGNNFWDILNFKNIDYLQQIVQTNQQYYEITYYQDTNYIITLSIALMTLSCLQNNFTKLKLIDNEIDLEITCPYHYHTHSEYIRKFCMPKYMFDQYSEDKTKI